LNSDSDNILTRDMGEQDDLHVEVMKTAFDAMKSDSDFISVNKVVNWNKKISILFSPLISDILSNISCCTSTSIILPDVSIQTIISISQLLQGGIDNDVVNNWTPDERKNLLEALEQLGLSSFINKDNGVTLTPARVEPPPPTVQPPKVNPVTIKKEKETNVEAPTEPVEPAAPPPPSEPMEQSEPANPQQEPVQPPVNPTTADAPAPVQEDVKNQCQKCSKSFPSVNQLKNHYCGHFLSLLKKKFENSYKNEKCLECNRIFPSLQKLLLHLGVVHDKINVILKMKGFRELPPFNLTNSQEKPSTTSAPDIKPVLKTPTVAPQASQKPPSSTTPAPAPTIPGPPPPPQTPVRDNSSAAPGPSKIPETPASEKKKLDEECNFDLKCQVCKQQTTSLHLLEQHLCRHFMKELQDMCSDLMDIDSLKCSLCLNQFKQKHSLVLHLGCKHGKINDVLRRKNFLPLPAPVLSNPTNAMQKKLIEVKKERFDQYTSKNSASSVVEETLNETSSSSSSTPNISALLQAPLSQATPSSSSSLDDILKKYNISTKFNPSS